MSYKILLAKIILSCRAKDFLDGNLYMNTDAYFAAMDADDIARADKDEGADEILQIKEIAIANKNKKWIPIGGVKSPLIYRRGNKEGINILCMYSITNQDDFHFDERNLNFGDTAIVIKDAKEFINRFKSAAKIAGRRLLHGPVEYIDKNKHHGQMGPFKKFNNYSYQSEFRFVLFGGNGGAIRFPIGDIRDISLIYSSSELYKLARTKNNLTKKDS